jgi:hypothetical protein
MSYAKVIHKKRERKKEKKGLRKKWTSVRGLKTKGT